MPVPPYSVLGILDAPVPVIVGSCASHVRPDFFCDPDNLVVVDDSAFSLKVPTVHAME